MSENARETAKGLCGGVRTAERLNQVCFCITLDRPELLRALDAEVGSVGFAAALATSHPSLLSNVPVFVTPETMIALTQVVAAVEAAARLHRTGQPPQSDLDAISAQRPPYLGLTNQSANIAGDTTAIVEAAPSQTKTSRSIV